MKLLGRHQASTNPLQQFLKVLPRVIHKFELLKYASYRKTQTAAAATLISNFNTTRSHINKVMSIQKCNK